MLMSQFYIQIPISAFEENAWDSSHFTLPLQNIYTAKLTVLSLAQSECYVLEVGHPHVSQLYFNT